MNMFNETPVQEAVINDLVESGFVWDAGYGDKSNFYHGIRLCTISREQFEARDGWIVWRGGDECPVKNGEIIDAKDADGTVHTRRVMGECNDIDPLFWSDSSYHEDRIVMYRLHKPSKTLPQGHPHAELMAQYAEDAKATDKPWELWEWSLKRRPDEWSAMRQEMEFEVRHNYRRKPKAKLIHGVEVPDINFTLAGGDNYYYPDPTTEHLVSKAVCMDGVGDHLFIRDMVYPHTEEGRQAAILHAKAMLGIATQSSRGGGREQNNEGDTVCM